MWTWNVNRLWGLTNTDPVRTMVFGAFCFKHMFVCLGEVFLGGQGVWSATVNLFVAFSRISWGFYLPFRKSIQLNGKIGGIILKLIWSVVVSLILGWGEATKNDNKQPHHVKHFHSDHPSWCSSWFHVFRFFIPNAWGEMIPSLTCALFFQNG